MKLVKADAKMLGMNYLEEIKRRRKKSSSSRVQIVESKADSFAVRKESRAKQRSLTNYLDSSRNNK